jgi:repressor LexA
MGNESLHSVQQALLKLLSEHIDDPLTIRELQNALSVSSTSVVAHHIAQLEKKGFLKRNPSDPRDYQILKDGPEKRVAYLNLYGLAHCGPNGSILDDVPLDRLPVSTRLLNFPASEGFLVKATGDSMLPRIAEGDWVIVRKANDAESGSLVVCVNNEEALIKKIQKEIKGPILVSLNPTYPPFFAAEDFRIIGKVMGFIGYASATL